ncbi:hypothetical protein SAMN04515669_3244 [Jiangella sp. DSM 45060]|nr:hypothetical protein SAMN04515669_3244 [Jiangella sp. DSM 45060]
MECAGSVSGSGSRKHWGSPHGGRSVGRHALSRNGDWSTRVGHHLYGNPVTTLDALDREWCSRCTTMAGRVYNRCAARLPVGRVRQIT